jgi:hypothetical protein
MEDKHDFTAINLMINLLMFVPGLGEAAMGGQLVAEFIEGKMQESVNTTAAALPSPKLTFGNFADAMTKLLQNFKEALASQIDSWLNSERPSCAVAVVVLTSMKRLHRS